MVANPNHIMILVLIAMVVSVISILAFKYADNSLGNTPIAATAEQLSED